MQLIPRNFETKEEYLANLDEYVKYSSNEEQRKATCEWMLYEIYKIRKLCIALDKKYKKLMEYKNASYIPTKKELSDLAKKMKNENLEDVIIEISTVLKETLNTYTFLNEEVIKLAKIMGINYDEYSCSIVSSIFDHCKNFINDKDRLIEKINLEEENNGI